MAHTLFSAAVVGLDGVVITVEADSVAALPAFIVVGLPDTAVQEARERVRAAIRNSGYPSARRKIIVNLAPADVRKEGTGYDLPIALSVLLATDEFRQHLPEGGIALEDALFVGELSLSGEVRSIAGALAIAQCAKDAGKKKLFLPVANVAEARLVDGVDIFPVPTLRALLDHLLQKTRIAEASSAFLLGEPKDDAYRTFEMIVGQEQAKRALILAAGGNHNVLMIGPPGSGKTMLASALPSILPGLTREEMIEVTRIWSVSGMLPRGTAFLSSPPFRQPHHTASLIALIGGGSTPKPGEVSLAHRGVLFLDEFPEFSRAALESLRQPLEEGYVTIARKRDHVTFPTRFLLVAAQNPCPCGYLDDPVHRCTCPSGLLTRYATKVSGPLLDRLDLVISVPRLRPEELEGGTAKQKSAEIRAAVAEVRARQRRRFSDVSWSVNGEMPSSYVRTHLRITDSARAVFRDAVRRYQMSGRVYFRILKVAQTVADFAGKDVIDVPHIAESLQYRFRETSAFTI